MYSFRNDYAEGAHPEVLQAIVNTNFEQTPGYTEDERCAHARVLIQSAIAKSDTNNALAAANIHTEDLQIEFIHGGTMANLMAITAALRPHECVIAAPDGHINVHETGAIEANGHKVVVTTDTNGFLTVNGIHAVMQHHEMGNNFHMVKPRMLYISLATEMGLVFTRSHLRSLYNYAQEHDLLLYIDGARIAAGLASEECDLTLADVCAYSDAFSLGGTKNGALFGEAMVIRNPEIGRDFRYIMKQKGAVVAKGRALGVQFETLFGMSGADAGIPEAEGDECLFLALGRHSVAMALKLKDILIEAGYTTFLCDSPTNQQFLILSQIEADFFMKTFDADYISRMDEETVVVRMTTRWSTSDKDILFVQDTLKHHIH